MATKKRAFTCSVVNEEVSICLRSRRTGGFTSDDELFVQCDQSDCQYVDENRPPCPLTLELFGEEIEEREERARERRRESEY